MLHFLRFEGFATSRQSCPDPLHDKALGAQLTCSYNGSVLGLRRMVLYVSVPFWAEFCRVSALGLPRLGSRASDVLSLVV